MILNSKFTRWLFSGGGVSQRPHPADSPPTPHPSCRLLWAPRGAGPRAPSSLHPRPHLRGGPWLSGAQGRAGPPGTSGVRPLSLLPRAPFRQRTPLGPGKLAPAPGHLLEAEGRPDGEERSGGAVPGGGGGQAQRWRRNWGSRSGQQRDPNGYWLPSGPSPRGLAISRHFTRGTHCFSTAT